MWLGLAAIAALLSLIFFRITSVLVALTLVPVAAGLAGGFGPEIGRFALDGMRSISPTAALLAFAVLYFGIMNDAGLFEPVIRQVVQLIGQDPLKITLGTAAIATVAHLDGAGASTFMITVPAMLPIYKRLGMDALTLAGTVALAAGTMNILPWGGPTSRAASTLQVEITELYAPLIVPTAAGVAAVFAFAALLGYRERARLAKVAAPALVNPPLEDVARPSQDVARPFQGRGAAEDSAPRPGRGGSSRTLWLFNAALTLAALISLVVEILPLPVIFLIACALALVVNYPDSHKQMERLTAHGSSAMVMVTTVLAAGLFTGIMNGTGMLTAMAQGLVATLPAIALEHLPIVVAVASMPLSLVFDPDSFYFGVLPVLAGAAGAAGGSAIEVGRAALLGQMTTGFPVSPLTPATFLLVGLAEVDLADHQRRTIPYAFAVTIVMTIAAIASGAIAL
jgi:CitMHS family citrate-Mg2+:H+ or citrate-Ca2+:H+ symporter